MESSEKLFYFILIASQVVAHTYCQDFTEKPRNTAVLKGQLATLVCRTAGAAAGEITGWTELITTVTGTAISANNFIQHTKGEAKYGVVNQYDLQVKNTEPSDAGKYWCRLVLANKESFAYIVVVDTRPSCTTDKANNIAAEGDTVTLTCQVDYHGGWGPKMQWTGPSGTELPTTDVSTGTTSKFTATVTANENLDGASYACALTFPKPPGSLTPNEFYDTRNPVFTSDCSVPLTVHYGPKNVQTTGAKQQYEPGDKIRCTARGKPTVTYRWEKISGDGNGFPVNGAELTISAQMEGDSTIQCVANNTVGGQLKDARSAPLNITVHVEVKHSTTTETTTTRVPVTRSTTLSTVTTALGIITAICVLAIIIIIVQFAIIWRMRNRLKQQQHNNLELPSNVSAEKTWDDQNGEMFEPSTSSDQKKSNATTYYNINSGQAVLTKADATHTYQELGNDARPAAESQYEQLSHVPTKVNTTAYYNISDVH